MSAFDPDLYNQELKKRNSLLKQYQKRHETRDGTPFAVSFLVTNRCILKCKHCFYHETIRKTGDQPENRELTVDEYEKLSNSMEWFMISMWCGGEPFMREDLSEIINIFRKNNEIPFCGTATNGQLTDNILKTAEAVCKRDPDKIYSLTISLEGFEEYHDDIRGRGTFRKALETWGELKKLAAHHQNLLLGTTTTLNSINQDTAPQFFNWILAEMKPNNLSLMKIRQNPRAGSHMKDVKPEKFLRAMQTVQQAIRDGRIGNPSMPQTYHMISANQYVYETMLSGKRTFTCYAGKHGAFIDYNGEVNVCEVFPDKNVCPEIPRMGNLREYDMDFLKLWNSKPAQKVKAMVEHLEACQACTHETEGIIPSLNFEPNEIRPFE